MTSIKQHINEIFYIFFLLSIYMVMCILYFLHISIQASHISGVWELHVAVAAVLDGTGLEGGEGLCRRESVWTSP